MTVEFAVGKAVSHGPDVRTYIATLNGAADFNKSSLMPRGGDRKVAVFNELQRVAQNAMNTAAPALDALKAAGLVTSYDVNPLSHAVVVDVNESRAAEAYAALNKVDGIGRVFRNREIHIMGFENAVTGAAAVQPGLPASPAGLTAKPNTTEWNVTKVKAPAVWAQGFTGKGVTVGIVDTGIDYQHANLHDKYRGLKPDGSYDNNYNWFDAVNNKTAPYDDNEHGTHVTGTVLGSTADGYHTGMAPDAKYIGSKILNAQGSGTLEGVMKGLQWMLAPTDSAGLNPDPTKAPDIISNSWGTNNGTLDTFRALMKSFVAAGIEPVLRSWQCWPGQGLHWRSGLVPGGHLDRRYRQGRQGCRLLEPRPEPDTRH